MADDEVYLSRDPDETVDYTQLTHQLHQGASPRELVVEACRRDQQHLIEQVLDTMSEKSNEEVAEFFNNVKDAMGNYALHICAMYGSCKSSLPQFRRSTC